MINVNPLQNITIDGIQYDIVNAISVEYGDVFDLKQSGQLIFGALYRITDYICTVNNDYSNAQAKNEGQFDILIVADSESTFNENVRFIQHSGDTYFSGCNLGAWEGKYCIDNDTTRFSWADDTPTGKGVIYWLKDEWGNECPYDFKNIQFKRIGITDVQATGITSGMLSELKTTFVYGNNGGVCYGQVDQWGDYTPINISSDITINYIFNDLIVRWYYTFTWVDKDKVVKDASIFGQQLSNGEVQYSGVFNNQIQPVSQYKFYPDSPNEFGYSLNNIVFISSHSYEYFGDFYGCYGNKFGVNCYNNTFGNDCNSNTLGSECYNNTFGNGCYYNIFGNDCYSNTFGTRCDNNIFGNYCDENTFGNYCYENKFGNGCWNNTLGNECWDNTFGNICGYNTFGNNCEGNTFGNGCYLNDCNIDYMSFCNFENGVEYCVITGYTTSNSNCLQNIIVLNGTKGVIGSLLDLSGLTVGVDYHQACGFNSDGVYTVKNLLDDEINVPTEQHKLLYSYDDKTLKPDFLMKEGIYVVDNEEDFEKCKGYFEENPPIYGMGGIVNGDSDGNGAWKKGYINSTVGIGSNEWVYNNTDDTIDATNNTDYPNYFIDVEPHYYINNIANIGYFGKNSMNDSIGVIFYTEFTGEDGELYCDYLTVECGNRVKSPVRNSVNVNVARRKKTTTNNNDNSNLIKYFQLVRSELTDKTFEQAPYLVRGDELVKVTATDRNQTYFTAVNTVKKGKIIEFYFSEKAFDLSVANKQQPTHKDRSVIFNFNNYTVQINGYSNDGTNTPFTLNYDISTTPMSYNTDGTYSTIISGPHPTQWVGGDDITDIWRNIAENGCFGYYQSSTPEGRVYNIQYIEGSNIVYNNLILRNDTNEVYELSGSTFDVLSGSIPVDYFTGSHISYNDITEKLWYSDGIEITQIATNCNCGEGENGEGGSLFCAGSGITFNDDNEDCVTINSNTEGTTVEDIRCTEGAPVDGRGLWDGGDIIPSGTTLQEILVKLLCRELFPKAATKPNIDLKLGSNGSLYTLEIGASVTIPSVTISKIDGKFNSGNYTKTQPLPQDVTFSGYTITSELNSGFSGYTEIDETNDSSGFTVPATTAIVLLGSNKITFDGKLYYTKPSNMPLTNLDNKTQSTKEISTDGTDISAIWDDSGATKTLTVTAEGVYPVFINTDSGMTSHIPSNVVDGIETANFAKLPLTNSNEIEFNEPGEEKYHLMIDFPKYYNDKGTTRERTLNIQIYNKFSDGYVSYTAGYKVEQEIKHEINGEYYEYKRLEFTGAFIGKDKYKLVFNASLNK